MANSDLCKGPRMPILPTVDKVCLSCNRIFPSTGKDNRLCENCNDQIERSGVTMAGAPQGFSFNSKRGAKS